MRGEVLHYDETQGFGFIAGSDGNRYTFRREDLRRTFAVSRGASVEFRESGGQARDVFPIRDEVPAAAQTTATPAAAASGEAAVSHSPQFGRFAASGNQHSTGLWSFFWKGITSNYANFRGRARRKEYWGYVLFFFLGLIAVSLVGIAIDSALGNMEPGNEMPIATIGLSVLFVLAGVIPGLAVSVRRFHDVGLSGWFYLLFLVLAFITIGGLIILIIGLIPSQKHENKWGPVPSGVTIPPPYSPAPATAETER